MKFLVLLSLLGLFSFHPIATVPAFRGSEWLNLKEGTTPPMVKGHITLVHFWTLGCINCKHNLPAVASLQQRFAGKGVQVIGIHSPEFDWEKPVDAVQAAIKKHHITYPVLVDADMENWRAWGQQYWPTLYLIDAKGEVKGKWTGELNYGKQKGEEEVARAAEKLINNEQ